MANLIAVTVLGVQYSLVILLIDLHFGVTVPNEIIIGVFIAFAGVAMVVWRKRKESRDAFAWAKLTLISIMAGAAFLGFDYLMAFLHGKTNPLDYPGGLPGLPLTFLACPVFTMICVAGFVRALCLSRREA